MRTPQRAAVPATHDGRHRDDAAAERLAEDHEVRAHAHELAGERRPRAAEAGLDLVGHEEHPGGIAQVADGGQVRRRGHDDERHVGGQSPRQIDVPAE